MGKWLRVRDDGDDEVQEAPQLQEGGGGGGDAVADAQAHHLHLHLH